VGADRRLAAPTELLRIAGRPLDELGLDLDGLTAYRAFLAVQTG
jgi:hypothetical protein